MKYSCLGLILLFSSFTLTAQDKGGPSAQSFPAPTRVISLACPVGMQAQQRASSQLVAVQNGHRAQISGQRIALTLRAAHSPRITSAQVKVRGLSPKAHVAQSKAGDISSEIFRTMTVNFDEESNGGVTGELLLPGFTSVTSIELQRIVYENETVWSVGSDSVCRVTPDPLMLISDR